MTEPSDPRDGASAALPTSAALPKAIASGAAAATPEAVHPLRVGIGAGLLAALYLFVLFLPHPVPARVIALFGGPTDQLGRQGGLEMIWVPPAGVDPATIEARFAANLSGAKLRRAGDTYVVQVPGVAAGDVDVVAARIGKGAGALRFHEVIETDEMKQLASLLSLPMKGAKPVDLEIDQWRADEDRSADPHTDYYLIGDTREAIEVALAKAAALGWKLPDGTHIAFEQIEATPSAPGAWRTYVLANRAELDGDGIASAVGSYDPYTNRPLVLLDFHEDAARTFGDLTARIVGKKLATVVDGIVKSAPIINGAIRGGRASITMGGGDPNVQERERDLLIATFRGAGLPAGGEVKAARYVPPGDTASRVWIARLLITVGGGALVGLLAWAVIRALRPTRRRAAPRASGPLPWRRIGVTLLAPLAVIGLSYVPIFGVAYDELADASGGDIRSVLNAGIFGIVPLTTAYILVELVALLVPNWRRRRHAGEVARRPIQQAVAALAFVLVMLQSWAIVQYLDALGRGFGVSELDKLARTVIAATLAGATLVFALVAYAIRRYGLGNGFAALLASGWLVGVLWPWLKHHDVLSADAALAAVTLLAMAVPLAVALRWRVGDVGEVSLRVPTSGIAPIGDGAGFAALVVLLGTLPFSALSVRVSDVVTDISTQHELVLAIVFAMTVVWSYAFARPAVLAGVAARAACGAPSRGTFWRATALSASVLLCVLAAALLTFLMAPSDMQVLTDPILVGIVVAVTLDAIGDLRQRRAPLVTAWSLQHPQYADLVASDLASAGIPCHLSSSRVRTLLAFFGPFVPIDVLVPPEHVPAARERIAKLLGVGLETQLLASTDVSRAG